MGDGKRGIVAEELERIDWIDLIAAVDVAPEVRRSINHLDFRTHSRAFAGVRRQAGIVPKGQECINRICLAGAVVIPPDKRFGGGGWCWCLRRLAGGRFDGRGGVAWLDS